MWVCSKCGEQIEDQFDSCWKCAGAESQEPGLGNDEPTGAPRVTFEVFSAGLLTGQNELCAQAAAFATKLGRSRLISLTAAGAGDLGETITVWYWTDGESRNEPPSSAEPPKHQKDTD